MKERNAEDARKRQEELEKILPKCFVCNRVTQDNDTCKLCNKIVHSICTTNMVCKKCKP